MLRALQEEHEDLRLICDFTRKHINDALKHAG